MDICSKSNLSHVTRLVSKVKLINFTPTLLALGNPVTSNHLRIIFHQETNFMEHNICTKIVLKMIKYALLYILAVRQLKASVAFGTFGKRYCGPLTRVNQTLTPGSLPTARQSDKILLQEAQGRGTPSPWDRASTSQGFGVPHPWASHYFSKRKNPGHREDARGLLNARSVTWCCCGCRTDRFLASGRSTGARRPS